MEISFETHVEVCPGMSSGGAPGIFLENFPTFLAEFLSDFFPGFLLEVFHGLDPSKITASSFSGMSQNFQMVSLAFPP